MREGIVLEAAALLVFLGVAGSCFREVCPPERSIVKSVMGRNDRLVPELQLAAADNVDETSIRRKLLEIARNMK